MAHEAGDNLMWEARSFVYRFLVEHERLPAPGETAAGLGVTSQQAELAYEELARRHALFLEPGSHAIRMAHPFSGVPTAFRVRVNGHAYWANCAWDMLGIPAALHADSAEIEAVCADTQVPTTLRIADGRVQGHGEVVYFAVPFGRWYDDLIFT